MAAKAKAKAKSNILVVEDDTLISRAYQDGLERADFVVMTAFNGKEAMEKLKLEKPDLVLLDLVMPGKDGFQVLKEMRMNDQLSDIPVIILSNLGQESSVQKGKALGATDYLVKADVSIDEIVERIKRALTKSKTKK